MKTYVKQAMTVAALFSLVAFAQAIPAGRGTQIEDGAGPEWIYKDCVKIEVGSGGSIHVPMQRGPVLRPNSAEPASKSMPRKMQSAVRSIFTLTEIWKRRLTP